ncbi:TPA: hypothetical protein RVG83_001566 [Escherichia coli]|nr:hypothetical protein [Escherichia coli]MBB7576655.1 hypothetical protein [Escherichia coli]MCQ1612389.1 hypothetical protein [Escherichia coli]HBC6698112.1 hypothetical protein [Escherichia coli]HCO4431432.1 hypothetical protein [Escherichia coli]HCP3187579.1 hypothetical protein [Escherichia coli]
MITKTLKMSARKRN